MASKPSSCRAHAHACSHDSAGLGSRVPLAPRHRIRAPLRNHAHAPLYDANSCRRGYKGRRDVLMPPPHAVLGVDADTVAVFVTVAGCVAASSVSAAAFAAREAFVEWKDAAKAVKRASDAITD